MPLRRVCTIAFCLVTLIVAAAVYPLTGVYAGEGFQPVSPEELKMTSDPLAPGAPAIILFRQVDRDDNGRTSHEDNYFRIKILTEEGRKNADVEIPFDRDAADVIHVRGRTIRPDGSIAEFDGKVFEKWLAKGKGLRVLAKTLTLPDVQVGSVIEYSYTIDLREHYIYGSEWILSQELFTRKALFSLKPFRSSSFVNSALHLRWSWNSLPPGAQPKEGPDHIIRMEASNIPAFQQEDFMPPANELSSRVNFIYSEDFPAKDADSFWRSVGKKRNGQLESFVGKRRAMDEALAQIVSPGDAAELKLRKIYDRVQTLRNTSYELRKTEQEEKREKEKVDTNVEDVWKRGYGSSVQLTWLFLALTRAAGFEAYGVWVSERRNYFFTPVTMESGRLDANVVLVKLNDKDLYFDPGAKFTPFGLLEWAETGVRGLRLDNNGGTWIRTTLPSASESRTERNAVLSLSDAGDLQGKLKITYTGLEALYLRFETRNEDDVAKKIFLEDRLKYQVPAGMEAELTNKPDWTSSETPLVAEFEVKIPGWASNAGRRAVLPAGVFTAVEKRMFEHANRVHPIYVEYPYEKVDDITIELPSGWQVSSLPPAQDKDAHVVGYTMKVEGDKKSLHLSRVLKIDFMFLEPKFYPALRNFFQTVRNADEEQIVLQPGSATAAN